MSKICQRYNPKEGQSNGRVSQALLPLQSVCPSVSQTINQPGKSRAFQDFFNLLLDWEVKGNLEFGNKFVHKIWFLEKLTLNQY